MNSTAISAAKTLKVSDDAAGKRGKCPKCGAVLRVPEPLRKNSFEEDDVKIEVVPPPPRLERGHVAHVPSVNVHLPKRTSSLGVVSLVLGVVGFLLCWIPLVGILTIPVSGLGLLLGGIGVLVAILRRGSGIAYPIAGTAVCALAFAIGSIQVAAIGAAADTLAQAGREAKVTNQEIVNTNSTDAVSDRLSSSSPSFSDTERAGEQDATSAENWASARNPVRQGDIQIRVLKVVTGKVPLKDSFNTSETQSEDDLLAIEVEVSNLSQSKKVAYRTWNGADFSFGQDFATLEDNFGNGYKRINFGIGADVVGQVKSDSIYPGKTLRDVLVFEPPVGNVQTLNLELPASNFDGEAMLRLSISADMIEHR